LISCINVKFQNPLPSCSLKIIGKESDPLKGIFFLSLNCLIIV